VLECHPHIFCFDELTAYKALCGQEYPVPLGVRWMGYKVPRWTEQLGKRKLWDPGLEEVGYSVYHREPILFMLRDVRDTVASMLRLRADAGKSWLEKHGPTILGAKTRYRSFRERFARDLDFVQASNNSLPLIGALYWKYKTEAFFSYRARGWPVCPVVYERLVTNPERELRGVMKFLDLLWHTGLLEHARAPHREVNALGMAPGNTDPSRPIEATAVGQWSRVLSSETEEQMDIIAGELNERIKSIPGIHVAIDHQARQEA
jgi:hypothetical protein